MTPKKVLILNFIIISSLIIFYITKGLWENNTSYIYPLDDTYIHLSIAKHLCFDHIWGITQYEFSSTSSSPLYTILLAFCMFIGGENDYYPLVLNIIFSFLCVYVFYLYFKSYNNVFLYFFASLIMLFFTPLHVQSISGMEHTLHIFGVLSIIYLYKNAFLSSFFAKNSIYLYAALFIFSLARYENMFLILSLSFVTLLSGNLRKTLLIGMIGFLPIIIFGLYSQHEGGFFFPNSLIAKSNTMQIQENYLQHIVAIFEKANALLQANKQMRFLGYLLLISLVRKGEYYNTTSFISVNYIHLAVFFTFILHILFAGFGWLYRYESYLLCIACIAISPTIFRALHLPKLVQYLRQKSYFDFTKNVFTLIFFFFFAKSSIYRLYDSHKDLQYASQNIYQQQFQMGHFLQKYYDNRYIIANDIGAIAYYSHIHLIDLVGLGSNDVLKAKLQQTNYPLEKAEIAIIYDEWFRHLMPASAKKVAEWKISNNVICGSDKVAFYAIKPENGAKLKMNLIAFQAYLPKGVECVYF